MSIDNAPSRRARMLELARSRVGKTMFGPGSEVPYGDLSPRILDCSGFVRWLCFLVCQTDAVLSPGNPLPSAATMFDALQPTAAPIGGDLAFYGRPGPPAAHVMMLTEDGGVIGACNEAGSVHEYLTPQYSARWTLLGFRRFPFQA